MRSNKNQRREEEEDYQVNYDPEDQELEPHRYKQINDQQIDTLIGQVPKKKRNNFQLTGKYEGKKASQQQEPSQSSEDQYSDQNQSKQDESAEEKNQYNNYRNSKKIDVSLLQDRLREVNQEDEQFVENKKKQQRDPQQANALKNQLNFYQKLLELRYNLQKNFQQIKKFPSSYTPYSQQLNQSAKTTEFSVLKSLDSLCKIQKSLYESSQNKQASSFNILPTISSQIQSSNIQESVYTSEAKLNVQGLYTAYQSIANQWKNDTEQSLIKWSNKTALLSQSKNSFQSLLMQTPIGQTQKILSSTMDKLLAKSRLKRTSFKILFNDQANIKQTADPQIFDDQDFFYQISKQYQSKVKGDDENQDGLLFGDTRKYLMERNNKQKQRKQVDRKASKHRKIRYNVHSKLLNFTAARQNPHLLEARDEIVKNIFNSAPKDQEVDYLQF